MLSQVLALLVPLVRFHQVFEQLQDSQCGDVNIWPDSIFCIFFVFVFNISLEHKWAIIEKTKRGSNMLAIFAHKLINQSKNFNFCLQKVAGFLSYVRLWECFTLWYIFYIICSHGLWFPTHHPDQISFSQGRVIGNNVCKNKLKRQILMEYIIVLKFLFIWKDRTNLKYLNKGECCKQQNMEYLDYILDYNLALHKGQWKTRQL